MLEAGAVFHRAQVTIGGGFLPALLPALPGAGQDGSNPLPAPPAMGDAGPGIYKQGGSNPSWEVPLAVRDAPGEILSAGFLQYLLTRSLSPPHDTPTMGEGTFWDGRDGWTFPSVKFDSLVLSSSGTGYLSCQTRWVLAGIPVRQTGPRILTAPPTVPTLLTRANVRFLPPWDGRVAGWNLTLSNNHQPVGHLNGWGVPVRWRPGPMTAMFTLMTQATGNVPLDGTPVGVQIIAPSGRICSLEVPLPTLLNRGSLQIGVPRNMRRFVWRGHSEFPATLPAFGYSTF